VYSTGASYQPDPRLRQSKDRIFRGYNDVASQCDFKTSTHGNTINRRYQWLVQIKTMGDGCETRAHELSSFAGCLRFKVVASGECPIAGPSDNRHPEPVIGGKLIPDALKLLMRLAVKGVHGLWPIQSYDADAPFVLHGTEFIFSH
jgi:hypothetical protein